MTLLLQISDMSLSHSDSRHTSHANTQQNRTVKSHCKFKVKGQYEVSVNHKKDIIYFQACWENAALEMIKK